MLQGRALQLTVVAILVGVVGAVIAWLLGRRPSLEPESYIRYVIVITLGVYAVVGALIVTRLAPGSRLRWTRGSPAVSVLLGAAIGGALGGLLLLVGSAPSGHLSTDPRIVTLMSEGDVAHVVATLVVVCACAPLVEEVLFRGLLLESMRGSRLVSGLLVSGVAFSLWHLNPSPLTCGYYVVMGLLLGSVYVRRGLAGSMSAHLAFNGVLAVAALAIVLAPAHRFVAGHISVGAPGGWEEVHEGLEAGGLPEPLTLGGPSGAALLVLDLPSLGAPSADTVEQRIRDGLLGTSVPGLSVDTTTTRALDLPAGQAVAVDVTAEGHGGTVVFLLLPQEAVEVVFLDGGSAKARADFPGMLRSLRAG